MKLDGEQQAQVKRQLDNSQLYAGEPMYYYCTLSGLLAEARELVDRETAEVLRGLHPALRGLRADGGRGAGGTPMMDPFAMFAMILLFEKMQEGLLVEIALRLLGGVGHLPLCAAPAEDFKKMGDAVFGRGGR